MLTSKNIVIAGILLIITLGVGIGFLIVKQAPTTKLQVAATIFPVGNIAREIAGDKIQVVTLLPIGASEHTYEPTLQNQQDIKNSRTLFAIGLGLDNWAISLATNQNIKVTELNRDVLLLPSAEPEEGEFDPHYWLSITGAKVMAKNIYEQLVAIDPDNFNYYRGNYETYIVELDKALAVAKAELTDIKSNQIITFHEAFSYFAAELDLEVVATIEPFPGKEPTAEYLSEVAEVIETHQVQVLFKEPQLSDAVLNSLARDYNVKIETLDPIGGVTGRSSYIETYLYNVRTIAQALKK
jgi:zinc transport system substrate-binding protein